MPFVPKEASSWQFTLTPVTFLPLTVPEPFVTMPNLPAGWVFTVTA